MDFVPQHSSAFRVRRFLNWFPLGLAYAFLYMGRYNLTVAKGALGDLMTKADFGDIFGVGAIVYGFAFVVNGPLTDRVGGRLAMLIGMLGSIVMNVAMGVVLYGITMWGWKLPIASVFIPLYAGNMYFQSFGAVAIVTTKAPWFHVRERGTFSTIFGVMISLGIYFAFDWGGAIAQATRSKLDADLGPLAAFYSAITGTGNAGVDQNWHLFFAPAAILTVLWVILLLFLRNTPGEAGHDDFDTGEEHLMAEEPEHRPASVGAYIGWSVQRTLRVFKLALTHPVLLVVCGIEFCSGVLRNGIMHWYPFFMGETGQKAFFIRANWGLMLLICGIAGSFLTGWASDRFFQSRRAPMAGVLYGVMFVSTLAMAFTLTSDPWIPGLAALAISAAVIGVHGILSGTSTADFGGSKNAGTVTGLVDGLVYLGTGFQAVALGHITPKAELAGDPANWGAWPLFLVPFAIVGTVLALRIWNAAPRKKAAPALAEAPAES
ncbi:MAG: MFS transporter [Myxococcales bacterium]|nr:MFS transporter [Myxococcales bacterium]